MQFYFCQEYTQGVWNHVALVYTGWSVEFWLNGVLRRTTRSLSGVTLIISKLISILVLVFFSNKLTQVFKLFVKYYFILSN